MANSAERIHQAARKWEFGECYTIPKPPLKLLFILGILKGIQGQYPGAADSIIPPITISVLSIQSNTLLFCFAFFVYSFEF